MNKMEKSSSKKGKGVMSKTWERCKSIGGRGGRKVNSATSLITLIRSKSWPDRTKSKKSSSVVPQGCFSVYVGPQMQRFVIKTEYANHPLFKTLLEEAESEYGYNSQGPLALPCHVDIFYKVLMEMDYDDAQTPPQRCACVNLKRSPSAYHLLPTSLVLPINHHF